VLSVIMGHVVTSRDVTRCDDVTAAAAAVSTSCFSRTHTHTHVSMQAITLITISAQTEN